MKTHLAMLDAVLCLAAPLAAAAANARGVYLYQLTDSGLSATLTVSGTKLFKDADLN